MTEITLRWSAIHSFMKCHRRYDLAYVQGISRKRGTDSRPLILGSHVHAGVQAALLWVFANPDATSETLTIKAVNAARRYNRENLEQGRTVYDFETRQQVRDHEYYALMGDVLVQSEWILRYQIPRIGLGTKYRVASLGEVMHGVDPASASGAVGSVYAVPMVEWTFAQNFTYLDKPYVVTGTVDTVLCDIETGEYILVDWKTRSRMPEERLVDLDGQLRLYAAVINGLSAARPGITRTCQYQINTSTPKPAALTEKTKRVSMAAIASTWEVWSDSVRALGLDPADYEEEMRPKLRAETDYTNPVFTPVTPAGSKMILKNTLMIGNAIRHASETGQFPAIPSLTGCQFCEFKSLCRAMENAGDVGFVMSSEYTRGAEIPEDAVDIEAA